jgi:hypothetical protein
LFIAILFPRTRFKRNFVNFKKKYLHVLNKKRIIMVLVGVIIVCAWTVIHWFVLPTRKLWKGLIFSLLEASRVASEKSFEYLLGEYQESELPPGVVIPKTDEKEGGEDGEVFEDVELEGEEEGGKSVVLADAKIWLKQAYSKTR